MYAAEVVCSNQNASDHSVLYFVLCLSAEHYIALLSVTLFLFVFLLSFSSPLLLSLCLSVYYHSLCLLDTLGFQS